MKGIEGLALANKDYVAEQYQRWKDDPASVDESWALFFAGFELGGQQGNGIDAVAETAQQTPGPGEDGGHPAETLVEAVAPVLGVFDLVHSYRELGHLVAHLNPLAPPPAGHPLLDPSEFGFGEDDLDLVVDSGSFRGIGAVSLRDLIARLQATYCRTLGVEYLHIPDREQRQWLQERMEPSLQHARADR